MDQLIDKVIRLEVKLRAARLYAFRGDFHFIDAQDMWMLRDDKQIDASLSKTSQGSSQRSHVHAIHS